MAGSKRVLIVDDDPSVLTLLRINFQVEGFEVVEATDGQEALSRLEATEVDAVVSDIMMPVMDGLTLLSRIRADRRTQHLPVILCSAKAQQTDVAAGLAAGADAYITKPFDPAELIETVERLTP